MKWKRTGEKGEKHILKKRRQGERPEKKKKEEIRDTKGEIQEEREKGGVAKRKKYRTERAQTSAQVSGLRQV